MINPIGGDLLRNEIFINKIANCSLGWWRVCTDGVLGPEIKSETVEPSRRPPRGPNVCAREKGTPHKHTQRAVGHVKFVVIIYKLFSRKLQSNMHHIFTIIDDAHHQHYYLLLTVSWMLVEQGGS